MSAGRKKNSQSRDWCTPDKYVDAAHRVLGGIDLDPCSNKHSIVNAAVEYKLPYDGLKETWEYDGIYVNPPYGADRERGTTIKDWLLRCVEAHRNYGSEVLALVPVATNTSHWKQCVFGQATAICFLADTRLKFRVNGSDENKGAPMACAMIYWGRKFDKFYKVFSEFGAVVNLRTQI